MSPAIADDAFAAPQETLLVFEILECGQLIAETLDFGTCYLGCNQLRREAFGIAFFKL